MAKQTMTDLEYNNPEPNGDNLNGGKPQAASDLRLLWGGLLIVAGLLFLFQNLGWFDFLSFVPATLWSIVWTGIFGLGGLAFLGGLAITGRKNWWMAIPGFALLGLSGTIIASDILRFIPFEGSIFLGSIGLGFVTVYVLNRDMWWAVIPGGVLGTLAVVAALDEVGIGNGDASAVFFFLGLGATFALVGLVPTPKGRMTWAWIPAGVMLIMSFVVLTSSFGLLEFLWPLAIIGIGVLILFRNLFQRRAS